MSIYSQSFSASIEKWHERTNLTHCSAFSCRKPTFEFQKCCNQPPDVLKLQDCFTVGDTKEWVAFGQLHCCDDGPAVKMWNAFARSALNSAKCLESCSRRWPNFKEYLECDCEKNFLKQFFVASSLPEKEKLAWDEWLDKVWFLSEQEYQSRRNLTRASRHASIELLLHALGLLEAVLAGPGLANEPPAGFPFQWRHNGHFFPFQDAIDYHDALLRRTVKLQSSDIDRSFRAPYCVTELETAEPVHIALVASVGEPVFGRKSLATVRSALHFACRRKIHLYLLVDADGEKNVREALSSSLDLHLSNHVAAITFVGELEMHRAWSAIKGRVPSSCVNAVGLGWSGVYGAPGWLRLFPYEVFLNGPEHLIWVDAGDYVFMADPALLLDAHIHATSNGAVASFPEGNVFPLQVFALRKMRQSGWAEAVTRTLRKKWREGNDTRGWLCYRGEGSMMFEMTSSSLFSSFAGEWAHEPRCHSFVGSGVINYFHYEHNVKLWDRHLHSGLVSPSSAYVFCPGFAEQVLHVLALGGCFTHPIFSVEVAQALSIATSTLRLRNVASDGFFESPVFGHQRIRCGKRILGIHMIRAFHAIVPWSLRFLDFWSNQTGLWGRSEAAPKLPTSL